MKSPKTIFMISLGCAKNLVDAENMLGILAEAGYEAVSDVEEARTVVVNTCGFIQDAVEEAIETILEMVRKKERGVVEKVLVTGCFVQRYGYKLRREIPEVDAWLGTGAYHDIVEAVETAPLKNASFRINRPVALSDHTTPRVLSGNTFSAYLKIAEGCSHACAFCIIPKLRGPYRSRRPDSLVQEAEHLAAQGAVELNLLAQDTTAYGRDLGGDAGLEDLLERLVEVEGIRWIRVQYAHPAGITDRLLRLVEREKKICPYLDIPFQHVNRGVLGAMGREGMDRDIYLGLLGRIRSLTRPVRVRTTLMVGFPGETGEAFEDLCSFVEEADLDFMGAFVFSPEKGSAAARMGGRVPRETAERRLSRLMEIQEGVSLRKKRALLGTVEDVLIEGYCPETELLLAGRTSGMAPEVDGRVLVNKGEAEIGSIVPVLLTEAYPHDLIGEIVG